jgi:hypothetical protein
LSNRILFLLVFCGLVASASAQSIFDHLDYLERLNYNVGGGLGIGRSYVAAFTGNSPFGVAGVGKNFGHLFSADAEYMYYDLGLRPSVEFNQGLPNAKGHMQSISLDGLVHAPYHFHRFGAYGIFGVGFYRRTVSVRPTTLVSNVTPCQPAYVRWWDVNCIYSGPYPAVNPTQVISSYSKNAGGFNFGGGITHPLNHLHNADLYFEWRYHRAYHSDAQTSVMPITIGLRW